MLFAGLTISALLCFASALPAIQLSGHAGRVEGEYIIVLKAPNADTANYVSNTVSKLSGVVGGMSIINSFAALKSPTLHIRAPNEAAVRQAYSLPEVEVVEANVRTKMIEQCAVQSVGGGLWGLGRLSDSTTQYSYDQQGGNGVRVYVLDTGIRTSHNDYGGRSTFGTNTIGGGNNDVDGHGTHCAGTIMGTTYGVSKSAQSVAVKVLDDQGFGSTASIIDGMNFAVADSGSGPKVISMSLGGPASTATDSAVASAVAAGVSVVVAAGNELSNACNGSPARSPDAITVGATDSSDTLSWFSNYGSCVDILAPGSGILSAGNSNDKAEATMSGTSMACPHVAGAAANYLSANPSATPAQVRSYLTSGAAQNEIDLRGNNDTPNLLLQQSC